MIDPEQTVEDTIAIMSFIKEMMSIDPTDKTREQIEKELDTLRAARESVYADYDVEDLKRMVRNVIRIFWPVFINLNLRMGSDPNEAWSDYCRTFAEQRADRDTD